MKFFYFSNFVKYIIDSILLANITIRFCPMSQSFFIPFKMLVIKKSSQANKFFRQPKPDKYLSNFELVRSDLSNDPSSKFQIGLPIRSHFFPTPVWSDQQKFWSPKFPIRFSKSCQIPFPALNRPFMILYNFPKYVFQFYSTLCLNFRGQKFFLSNFIFQPISNRKK